MKRGEKKGVREDTYLNKVGEAIKAAMPALDKADQQVAAAVYRLMSRGAPVETTAVADSVGGITADSVNERLNSWPGVFRDDSGRVVGFWGHAIDKLDPEYRLIADGNTTYAWCALDTLFIPGIIGKVVRVEASDPISREAVSVLVDGDGVREVTPAGALVSMAIPDGPFGYDVIESFCHRVLFFASDQTGAAWIAKHKGATLLSVEQAFELGRVLIERVAPGVSSSESRGGAAA